MCEAVCMYEAICVCEAPLGLVAHQLQVGQAPAGPIYWL